MYISISIKNITTRKYFSSKLLLPLLAQVWHHNQAYSIPSVLDPRHACEFFCQPSLSTRTLHLGPKITFGNIFYSRKMAIIFYLCSNFKHIFLSYRYICTDAFKEFPLKSKRKCAFPISSGSSIFNCVSTMIFMLFRVVSISRCYWFRFVYYCDKNLTNEPLVSNGLPCKIISCFCKVIYD